MPAIVRVFSVVRSISVVHGLRYGQDEERTTQITQMRLRRCFAHRICCSSLAFPSERTGGVAVANAPANAREAFLLPLFLSSCFRFGGTVASRAFLAAFAITIHEVGSEARLRCATATSTRPAPGGRESGVKKCDERSRRRRRHLRYLRFFSSSCPRRRFPTILDQICSAPISLPFLR